MSNQASSEICVAYWNKVTGNVWAENSSGSERMQLAGDIWSPNRAYEVIAQAGMVRRGSWIIVPGMPKVRQCTAVFPQ